MRGRGTLASILALAIVLGAVSLATAAVSVGGFPDMAGNAQAKQVAYLRALGIAKGDENGKFNPHANLTRQEFVTFVARLAGQEAAAAVVAGSPSRYLDDTAIADWARGAVILADTNGWVKGYDDGKFHPQDSLTYAQAVTVLIRVLGHEAMVTGDWPSSHLIKSTNLRLDAGVSVNSNAPISRADMGRLLYNALFIERLVQSGGTWQPAPAFMGPRTISGEVKRVQPANIELYTLDPKNTPPVVAFVRPFAADVVLIGADNLNALTDLNVRLTVTTRTTDAAAQVTIIEVLDDVKTGSRLTFERFATSAGQDVLVLSDGSEVPYDSSNGNQATVSVNGSALVAPKGPNTLGFPTWAQALRPGDWVVITQSGGKLKHIEVTNFFYVDVPLHADAVVQSGPQKHSHVGVSTTQVALPDATITLNGAPATPASLKQYDVVDVAFRYTTFNGLADRWEWRSTPSDADPVMAPIAHTVSATRNSVTGEVTGKRVTFPGPVYYTTVKTADGTREYEWRSGTPEGTLPAEGTIVTLLLSSQGRAVLHVPAPAPIASGEYAVFKSVTTAGGESSITLDVNGNTITLPVAAGATIEPAGHINTDRIGQALQILISGGKVTHAQTALSIPATVYNVVSVDAATGTVVIKSGSETIATENTLQYQGVGASYTDIGAPVVLKAGDQVKVGHTGFANTAGIKLLLLQP